MLQIPTSLCGSWRDRGRENFPTIRHVLGFFPTVQAPAARGGVHSFLRCRKIRVTAWQGPISNMIKQQPLRRLHRCGIDGTAWSLSRRQAGVLSGMFVFVRQQWRSSGTRWCRTGHIRRSRVSRTQAWGRWTWLEIHRGCYHPLLHCFRQHWHIWNKITDTFFFFQTCQKEKRHLEKSH